MSSNSIYPFQKVLDFLQSIGAENVYHANREWYIKNNHLDLHSNICDKTAFLINPTFTERLFCYTNDITYRPKCKVCDNYLTYNSRGKCYHTYCSQRCSMLDMKSLIGVENASQMQSVKDKKKQNAIKKYGVDNVAKSDEIKQQLSQRRKEYWSHIYKNKEFTFNGLTKTQYRRRCQQYLNTQYNRYKYLLDPANKRGTDWHIDHIYSVSDGFLNNVPINVISDISNLRLISATDNYRKSKTSGKTIINLYEDFMQQQMQTHNKP